MNLMNQHMFIFTFRFFAKIYICEFNENKLYFNFEIEDYEIRMHFIQLL